MPRQMRASEQRVCVVCGATFRWFVSNKGAGACCSHACASENPADRRHRRGPENQNWRGGRTIDSNGYVMVRVYDESGYSNGYKLEHRVVMEQKLGRPLLSSETVHHINGEKMDNREENLQLRSGRHGNGVVHECADCGSRNIREVDV